MAKKRTTKLGRPLGIWKLKCVPYKVGDTAIRWWSDGKGSSFEAALKKHGRKWQFIVSMWVGEVFVAYSAPPAYNSRRNAHAGLVNWLEPLVHASGDVGIHFWRYGRSWCFRIDWGGEDEPYHVYQSPYVYDAEEFAQAGAETFVAHLRDLARRIREGQ